MIEFRNVSKVYDNGTKALKNVNLRINRGEFVFVVGASGAGKSTFLKTIMREEVPTSGSIMINNYDLTKMTKKEIPYYRRTLGIVFQDFRLIPTMTVYDNVAFAMRVIGANEKEIRKRVPYVLSLVGLSDKAKNMPTEISGGEQQRVALARALVNNANTIIADEPTGNVDPEMSYEIVDLLNRINENGTTIIMVTHEHDLVKHFNHRIVVIDDGAIVSDMGNGGGLHYDQVTGYQPEPALTTMQTLELESLTVDTTAPDPTAARYQPPVYEAPAPEPVRTPKEIPVTNTVSAPIEIPIPGAAKEAAPAGAPATAEAPAEEIPSFDLSVYQNAFASEGEAASSAPTESVAEEHSFDDLDAILKADSVDIQAYLDAIESELSAKEGETNG